jgi:hypothetical protein
MRAFCLPEEGRDHNNEYYFNPELFYKAWILRLREASRNPFFLLNPREATLI